MIVERQTFEIERLLMYQTIIDDKDVPMFLSSLYKNIQVLDVQICGSILITKQDKITRFFVPIDKIIIPNKNYGFKEAIKIKNALKFRHYGGFRKISDGLQELNKYIFEKKLDCLTDSYIVPRDFVDYVYDIYVGIS